MAAAGWLVARLLFSSR